MPGIIRRKCRTNTDPSLLCVTLATDGGSFRHGGRVPWRQVIIFRAPTYGLNWLWWAPMVWPKLGGLSLGGPLPDLTRDPAPGLLGLSILGPLVAAVVMRLAVSREGVEGTLDGCVAMIIF